MEEREALKDRRSAELERRGAELSRMRAAEGNDPVLIAQRLERFPNSGTTIDARRLAAAVLESLDPVRRPQGSRRSDEMTFTPQRASTRGERPTMGDALAYLNLGPNPGPRALPGEVGDPPVQGPYQSRPKDLHLGGAGAEAVYLAILASMTHPRRAPFSLRALGREWWGLLRSDDPADRGWRALGFCVAGIVALAVGLLVYLLAGGLSA